MLLVAILIPRIKLKFEEMSLHKLEALNEPDEYTKFGPIFSNFVGLGLNSRITALSRNQLHKGRSTY